MYSNILVPTDLSGEQNVARAYEVARQLLSDGGKITALNVIEPLPGYIATELPPELATMSPQKRLEDLKAELGGATDITPAVVIGHAGRSIVDQAEEDGCDLIVIASHRPGFADIFLGSTAAWVVRHAKCSVHVVR